MMSNPPGGFKINSGDFIIDTTLEKNLFSKILHNKATNFIAPAFDTQFNKEKHRRRVTGDEVK